MKNLIKKENMVKMSKRKQLEGAGNKKENIEGSRKQGPPKRAST